jgi:solute carrier family 25 (mitochondrial S-adenosylmethionine transporter), member 26
MAREAATGALAGIGTDFIFYGLDSYKIQKQGGNGKVKFSRLWKGIVPVLLTGTGPSFAAFFGIYAPMKDYLTATYPDFHVTGCTLASVAAGASSSIIGGPGDVIKKRVILGVDGSASECVRSILASSGVRGLFIGWHANMIKDVPFAAIKLGLYEGLSVAYLKHFKNETHIRPLDTVESAAVGLLSGAATGVVTTPLDVINTLIKSGEVGNVSLIRAFVEVKGRWGVAALFRGVGPRTFIMGFGSTVFWAAYTNIWSAIGGGSSPSH